MKTETKSALMDKQMVIRAIKDSFYKLAPKTQAKNPVMLLVYISAILTTALFVISLFGIKDANSGFTLGIAVILWFTVLFANFAEAIAEGRGKAQADSLRAAKKEFITLYPGLDALNIMGLHSKDSAIFSAIIYNALIIIALIPLALKGVKYREVSAGKLLSRNLLVYGLGGIIAPFICIKIIDVIIVALHIVS